MVVETIICAACYEEIPDDTPHDEMQEEFEQNFPNHQDEPPAIVCDDCYKWLMAKLGRLPAQGGD